MMGLGSTLGRFRPRGQAQVAAAAGQQCSQACHEQGLAESAMVKWSSIQ